MSFGGGTTVCLAMTTFTNQPTLHFCWKHHYISLSTCHPETNFEADLHVEIGTCDGACVTNTDIVVDPPVTCYTSFGKTVTFDSVKDMSYFVAVSGGTNTQAEMLGATGSFGLTLSTFNPPSNDDCRFAAMLPLNTSGKIVGSTINATLNKVCEGSKVFSSSASQYGRSVWYRFVGTGGVMR